MEPVFNKEKAIKRTMGDQELLKELVTFTLEDMDEQLEEIRLAFQQGMAHTLKEAAHKLKGSAGAVGADRLFYASFDLEQKALSQGKVDWETALEQVEKEAEQWRSHPEVLGLQSS